MESPKNSTAERPLDTRSIGKYSKARAIAARLGVCPRTIFRWADDGKLRRHKINARVVLFDESEVSNLLSASRIEKTMELFVRLIAPWNR